MKNDPWEDSPWQQQEDFNKRHGEKRYEVSVPVGALVRVFKWIFGKKEKQS